MWKLTIPTDHVTTTIHNGRSTARTYFPIGERPRKAAPYLPLDTRLKLFHVVKELRSQGLSYGQLQKHIFDTTGRELSKSSVSYWVRGIHNPLGRVNAFTPTACPELAYAIGVALSDGNLNVHEHHREILLSVTDRDFAEEFSRCLAKLLHRALPYKVRWSEKRKRCIVQGASIFLYKFLSHQWLELKAWIEHCNKCTACYLRDFFDGEGCISRRQLTISNTNVELLVYARELLRKFGVESTGPYLGKLAGTVLKDSQTGKLYKRKKNCYYSYVSVRNLPQFAEHIGFTIERKQRRLRAACT